MTPGHTLANGPALPISADGRASSFSFSSLRRRSALRLVRRTQAVAHEIHNMNALDRFKEALVHIMNFIVANQRQSAEIHNMNFMDSKQVEQPSVQRKINGADKAGAPSTYKGARNVMS